MNLPFTNIRQVLSLHNKVSPEKIFLTVITEFGREELSYAEFSARCHQTANFLQEDLYIEPGDVVGIVDDQPLNEAILIMACWLVGAVVVRGTIWQAQIDIKAQFFRRHDKPQYENFAEIAKLENSRGKSQLIQLGGLPTEGYPHFDTLVRSMPNSFFNDHSAPTLNSPASKSINHDTNSVITITQGELLAAAKSLADSQSITGNQRIISCLPLSGHLPLNTNDVLDALSVFIASLLVGGSLVVDTRFFPHVQSDLWGIIAAERLHIAYLAAGHLAELTAYAREQKALGNPIYGTGIYQQDIQQLRHIYCPDAKGQDDLIRQFTDMFPFPIVTTP